MPIPDVLLGPMLGTFRQMAQDCKDKGHSGDAFDNMMAALERMEALGQEMDDFAAYSAKITTEGLQMQFSTAYGEVLSAAAKESASAPEDYDDAALLKQTVDAYRNAIHRLKEGTQAAKAEADKSGNAYEIEALSKDELLIAPIEEAIALGESEGMNLPTFLRLMIEKGLDKAMEGSAALREGLEYDLGWAKASNESPHHIALKEEILAKFDELAGKAAFGVPDSLQFELERKLIEHKFVPPIAKWKGTVDKWHSILSAMDFWVIAHTKFAPYIEPWNMARDVKAAILETKDTTSGEIKVREQILHEYFGLSFHDIFHHETFWLEVETFRFDYSQEYTEFLIKTVYPVMEPCKHLPDNIVKEANRLYEAKRMANPERLRVLESQQSYYDSVFGEGKFWQKFDRPEPVEANAAPWNLDTFSAG